MTDKRNKPRPRRFLEESERIRLIRKEPRNVLVKVIDGRERIKILDRRRK